MNKFPHDWGQLYEEYMEGGHNGNEGKMVEDG
jgi:hypothetical protein